MYYLFLCSFIVRIFLWLVAKLLYLEKNNISTFTSEEYPNFLEICKKQTDFHVKKAQQVPANVYMFFHFDFGVILNPLPTTPLKTGLRDQSDQSQYFFQWLQIYKYLLWNSFLLIRASQDNSFHFELVW